MFCIKVHLTSCFSISKLRSVPCKTNNNRPVLYKPVETWDTLSRRAEMRRAYGALRRGNLQQCRKGVGYSTIPILRDSIASACVCSNSSTIVISAEERTRATAYLDLKKKREQMERLARVTKIANAHTTYCWLESFVLHRQDQHMFAVEFVPSSSPI